MFRFITNSANKAVLVLLKLYQWAISPMIHLLSGPGFGCRFQPTCSEYAIEAFRKFSFPRSGFLVLKRLSRCHPGCKGGWDPIP